MNRGRPKTNLETKSKRLNLLIKPSTYEAIDKIVYVNRLNSVNSLVNEMLENYIATHVDDIHRYNEFFAGKEI